MLCIFLEGAVIETALNTISAETETPISAAAGKLFYHLKKE